MLSSFLHAKRDKQNKVIIVIFFIINLVTLNIMVFFIMTKTL